MRFVQCGVTAKCSKNLNDGVLQKWNAERGFGFSQPPPGEAGEEFGEIFRNIPILGFICFKNANFWKI